MLRKDLYKFPVDLGGKPARQDWEEGKNTICFFKAKIQVWKFFLCRFLLWLQNGDTGSPLICIRSFFLFLKLMMDVVFWGPGEKIDDSQLWWSFEFFLPTCVFFGNWWIFAWCNTIAKGSWWWQLQYFLGSFTPIYLGKNLPILMSILFRWVGWKKPPPSCELNTLTVSQVAWLVIFETAHVLPPQKKGVDMNLFKLPSLKLTAKATENWWF